MSDTQRPADKAAAPSTIAIHPQAALSESLWLIERVRQRNLYLANQVHELTATVEGQAAEIERLTQAANGGEAADAD